MPGHVCLTGLEEVFQLQLPSPPTYRLLHPVRHKKPTKRTRQSATGNAYEVGGYRDNDWNPECPRLSMPFAPPASLMFLPGDVFDGHRQQEDPAPLPLLTPHAGGDIDPPPPGTHLTGHVRRCRDVRNGPSSCSCRQARPLMRMRPQP